MVGGIVCEVEIKETHQVILVQGTGVEQFDFAQVGLTLDDPTIIRPGDQLWWQGHLAYWTPRDKSREDVPMKRYGYAMRVSGALK